MDGVILWRGFDFTWRKEPHRANRLTCSLDNFEQLATGQVSGQYTSVMKYGDFGDDGDAYAYVSRVNCGGVRVVHGDAELTVSGEVDAESQVVGNRIAVPIPASLGQAVNAAAVLRGFSIRAQSHPSGITTRGFSCALTGFRRDVDALSFQPRCTIHPANSPDRPKQDPSTFTYNMRVLYTAILVPSNAGRFFHKETAVNYDGPRKRDETLRKQDEIHGQGLSVFGRAAVGISGFSWHLGPWPSTKHDGRYLRRLLFSLKDFSYSAQSGVGRFVFETLFSNQSPIEYGYAADHVVATTLLQYNSDDSPASMVLHNEVNPTLNDTTQQSFIL